MYKQIIIVRKDLQMSHGKMAAQVSHASMAFLTNMIRSNNLGKIWLPEYGKVEQAKQVVMCQLLLDPPLFYEWINGAFTKVILQARNKSNLMKAADMAKELGLKRNDDYFIINDNCCKEFEPENPDNTTTTCIGFKPMDSEIIDQISRKYHLYMG